MTKGWRQGKIDKMYVYSFFIYVKAHYDDPIWDIFGFSIIAHV